MHEGVRRLAWSALVVMVGFMASRLLGLVRNMVILHQFGAGRETEAFMAANAIPDFIFQVLVGGAVGSAFIPVFAGYVARDKEEEAWRLTNNVITLAAMAVGLVALALFILARPIVGLLVAGRDPAFQDMVADLTRIMLVSPVLFAVSGFAMSVLESYQRFLLAAIAPVAYNLAVIASALLLYYPLGIYGVAVGVSIGAFLHLAVQVPGLWRKGWRYRFLASVHHEGVREVARLMAPRVLGLGVVQLNQLAVVVLASFLTEGSLVFLNVAWMMVLTPLVLAMSVSRAVFPSLARESAREHGDELAVLFTFSLRAILYLTVPAAAGLMVMGEPLVRLFFERGGFTAEATRLTAFALGLYSIGLVGHAVVEISDRAFYALKDTRTPVLVASCTIATNIVLSLALMRVLSFGGLALAGSLAALLEAGILLYLLARRMPRLRSPDALGGLPAALLRVLLASILMAGLLDVVRRSLAPALQADSVLLQGGGAAVAILTGAIVYFLLTALLRTPEPALLVKALRRAG